MSAMKGGSMPKASEKAKAAFQAILPKDPAVAIRPMFGNLASFVNGNMFAGLFGDDLFVRLADDELAQVVRQGGKAFEPMPGRPMRGYVCVPSSWQRQPEVARSLIVRSLAWSRRMPAKKPTKK